MTTTFYMVYVEGGNNPTYKHESHSLALEEAKRLTQRLNKPAYVLEAVQKVELQLFNVETLTRKDELPF